MRAQLSVMSYFIPLDAVRMLVVRQHVRLGLCSVGINYILKGSSFSGFLKFKIMLEENVYDYFFTIVEK